MRADAFTPDLTGLANDVTEEDGTEIVVGSRGSALALWQTEWVIRALREQRASPRYRVQVIKTQGDATQASHVPLTQLGDKAMFVAELERALLAGAVDVAVHPMNDRALVEAEQTLAASPVIDVAVHSLKDLPSELAPGLTIAAVPEREDARDVLISRSGRKLHDLPQGAYVATSSLRRQAQLLHRRPDLRIVPIRGNIDTRVRKALAADGPDALVVAAAGVHRLGLGELISEYFSCDVIVPAVGQGALAVETRTADARVRRLVMAIDHPPTRYAVTAERAVLLALNAGCLVPVGAHAAYDAPTATLHLQAIVARPDGRNLLRATRRGPAADPVALGRAVAQDLLVQGAAAILQDARK
jgi:hydroxymethylbilane synthase